MLVFAGRLDTADVKRYLLVLNQMIPCLHLVSRRYTQDGDDDDDDDDDDMDWHSSDVSSLHAAKYVTASLT